MSAGTVIISYSPEDDKGVFKELTQIFDKLPVLMKTDAFADVSFRFQYEAAKAIEQTRLNIIGQDVDTISYLTGEDKKALEADSFFTAFTPTAEYTGDEIQLKLQRKSGALYDYAMEILIIDNFNNYWKKIILSAMATSAAQQLEYISPGSGDMIGALEKGIAVPDKGFWGNEIKSRAIQYYMRKPSNRVGKSARQSRIVTSVSKQIKPSGTGKSGRLKQENQMDLSKSKVPPSPKQFKNTYVNAPDEKGPTREASDRQFGMKLESRRMRKKQQLLINANENGIPLNEVVVRHWGPGGESLGITKPNGYSEYMPNKFGTKLTTQTYNIGSTSNGVKVLSDTYYESKAKEYGFSPNATGRERELAEEYIEKKETYRSVKAAAIRKRDLYGKDNLNRDPEEQYKATPGADKYTHSEIKDRPFVYENVPRVSLEELRNMQKPKPVTYKNPDEAAIKEIDAVIEAGAKRRQENPGEELYNSIMEARSQLHRHKRGAQKLSEARKVRQEINKAYENERLSNAVEEGISKLKNPQPSTRNVQPAYISPEKTIKQVEKIDETTAALREVDTYQKMLANKDAMQFMGQDYQKMIEGRLESAKISLSWLQRKPDPNFKSNKNVDKRRDYSSRVKAPWADDQSYTAINGKLIPNDKKRLY